MPEKSSELRSLPVLCFHPNFYEQKCFPFAHDGKNLICFKLKDIRPEDLLIVSDGPRIENLKRQLEQFQETLKIGYYPDPKTTDPYRCPGCGESSLKISTYEVDADIHDDCLECEFCGKRFEIVPGKEVGGE